jgi:hypothetical protein
VDTAKNQVIVNVTSVQHPLAPESEADGIRISMKATYWMKPISENETYVQGEYYIDPKGNLPAFLVNMLLKTWPYRSAAALKKQLRRDYIRNWEPFDRVIGPFVHIALDPP